MVARGHAYVLAARMWHEQVPQLLPVVPLPGQYLFRPSVVFGQCR